MTTIHEAEPLAAEATEDPETEAWAVIVGDLLYHVPPEKRLAVLAVATAAEGQDRKVRPFEHDKWMQSPGMRYWHDVMRLKSRVIYTFTRRIRNSHSREDAERILFQDQCGVPGSGWLPDYLDGLPCVKIDLKKAAKLEPAA